MYSQLFLTSDFYKSSNHKTSAKNRIIIKHDDYYENEDIVKTKRKSVKHSPISLSVKSLLLTLLGVLNLANATYDYVNITYDNTVNYEPRLKNNAPIYQNEFAVYIPKGQTTADAIAHRYGFENMGQVS